MSSLAVCLGDVHGSPCQLSTVDRARRTLNLSVLTVFLRSTFFKGRKLAFLYFL